MTARPTRSWLAGALLLAGSLPGSALANALIDAHQEHTGYAMPPAVAAEATAGTTAPVLVPKTTAAVVRKVDKATGKVTLKHDRIENLGMPAMTMVFRVSKPELLDGTKVGDAVRFHAEAQNGVLVVTAIEAGR